MTRSEWEHAVKPVRDAARRGPKALYAAQRAFSETYGFMSTTLRHEAHVAQALFRGEDVPAEVLRDYPPWHWQNTNDLAYVADLEHYRNLLERHGLNAPAYLITRAFYGVQEHGTGEEIAVAPMERIGFARECARSVAELGKQPPGLGHLGVEEVRFKDHSVRWFDGRPVMDRDDIVKALENGPVIVKRLPENLQSGASPQAIPTGKPVLAVRVAEPFTFYWETKTHEGETLNVRPIDLKAINQAPVFEDLTDPGEAPLTNRIIGTITGDYTDYVRHFDCTEAVLTLDAMQIRHLTDHDYSTDDLVPEALFDEARAQFDQTWGQGFRDVVFGYEVSVTESIESFFGVSDLSEITDAMVESARQRFGLASPDGDTQNGPGR